MGFTASVLTLECETISPSPKSNIQVGNSFSLRLCLFWVKIISGNGFPEMRLFGWSGKFYFPEIEIRWPKKNAFDHGNRFTLLFSLQSISGKWERERERVRACARGEATNMISPPRDSAIGRDLAVARSCRWSRSRDGEIAPVIVISPSRDRAESRSRSTAREEDPRSRHVVCRPRDPRGRSVEEDREIPDEDSSIVISDCGRRMARSGLWLVFFWICVFLLLFQTPKNIFRKIFWNATKHHGNIFLFRKLTFLENMYFPENVLQQPNIALDTLLDVKMKHKR